MAGYFTLGRRLAPRPNWDLPGSASIRVLPGRPRFRVLLSFVSYGGEDGESLVFLFFINIYSDAVPFSRPLYAPLLMHGGHLLGWSLDQFLGLVSRQFLG